jgi:peptide/nickel transport system substrate-binding protein
MLSRATTRSPLALLLGGALLLTGCSAGGGYGAGGQGADASPAGTGAPAAAAGDGTLGVVGPFEVHSVDPATAGGVFTRLEVAETLVDADADGTLLPALATGWTPSEDGLRWTFDLRPGATFHDGTPVTAEAVVAALEVAATQEATPLAEVPLAGVTAEGEAVVVDLQEPFSPLPAVLAHTSTQVLAPASYGEDGAVEQVIGSGPYAVASLDQPARVTTEVSQHWDGEAPAVRSVQYQAVGRAETRALMAESGQADVTFGMDPTSLQRLTGSQELDIVSVTLPRTIQLTMNAGHPALSDVRVRQALSLALDRDAMATALLRDEEMAATQLFPPTLQEWHVDGLDAFPHDLDRAAALLDEAGWTLDADGTRQRDGEALSLQLRTFPDRPELPVIATAVQAAWAELGVPLEVVVGNSSEIPAAVADGSLQTSLYSRNYALVPDPVVTLLGDFGADGADFGAMGWQDEELVADLTAIAAGGDGGGPDTAAARERVVATLHEQLPVVPVAWYRQSAVVSDRVEGVEVDPLERTWRISDMAWTS